MDPGWPNKVKQALENAIELLSPGTLTFAVNQDEQLLAVAPSLLEQEDKEDGDVFPFFNFDVTEFVMVFDAPPEITWYTYPGSALWFEGAINGQEALVQVFDQPFKDAEPVGILSKKGAVRELSQEDR